MCFKRESISISIESYMGAYILFNIVYWKLIHGILVLKLWRLCKKVRVRKEGFNLRRKKKRRKADSFERRAER